MKFDDVSFPHPVLGIGNSIESQIRKIEPGIYVPTISKTDNYYVINLILEHDNDDLKDLIRLGQAEYFCEATCSDTLYRIFITESANEITLKIPNKMVKGRVNFTCALVATGAINNYNNKKFHSDYSTYSFDIERGDILAYFGEFYFDADIIYEKLRAVSSFMEVVENKDDKAVSAKIELGGAKIEVQLPSEEYKMFADDSISKEPQYASIFHSSIVLNALLIALYNLESYKGTQWANAIEYRLKSETLFDGYDIEDKENIPEVAQRLLGNPIKRLLSGIKSSLVLATDEGDE